MKKSMIPIGGGGGGRPLLFAHLLLVGVTGAFAQYDEPGIAIGARAGVFFPFPEAGDDLKDTAPKPSAIEFESKVGLNLAVQVGYDFTEFFGVQLEGIFTTIESDLEYTGVKLATLKAQALQIPLLLKGGILFDSGVYLGALAGVYYMLPLGDGKLTITGSWDDEGPWTGSFGFTGGGLIGIEAGPGLLFADIRYSIDFSDIEFEVFGETTKVLKLRGLGLTVGYLYKFGM
jgi:hypothetical protein